MVDERQLAFVYRKRGGKMLQKSGIHVMWLTILQVSNKTITIILHKINAKLSFFFLVYFLRNLQWNPLQNHSSYVSKEIFDKERESTSALLLKYVTRN